MADPIDYQKWLEEYKAKQKLADAQQQGQINNIDKSVAQNQQEQVYKSQAEAAGKPLLARLLNSITSQFAQPTNAPDWNTYQKIMDQTDQSKQQNLEDLKKKLAVISGKQSEPSKEDVAKSDDSNDEQQDEVTQSQAKQQTPAPQQIQQAPQMAAPQPVQQPGDPEMQKAMEQMKQNQFDANLSRIGAQMGNAITGGGIGKVQPEDLSYSDMLQKQAGQPVEMLQTQRASEKQLMELKDERQKNDPNSDISKFGRGIMSEFGIPESRIPKNMSYAQMEKQFPQLAKIAELREATQSRVQMQSLMNQQKQDQRLDQGYIQMADRLAKVDTSARGAVGKEQTRLNAAKHAKGILDQYKGHYQDMPPQYINELSQFLNAMISAGSPTVAGTKQLEFTSLPMEVSKGVGWLTSTLAKGHASPYVKLIEDAVQRQEQIASDIVDTYRKKWIGSYEHQLKDKDPGRWHNEMVNQGFEVPDATPGQDPDILSYAKDHFNGDYQKAEAYLRHSGQLK